MFVLYSLVYTIVFIAMLPVFAVGAVVRGKRSAGFFQRLGFLPRFETDERKVVWLHSVSVGETNAARPLVEHLRRDFPDHRLIISTTTRTGQELARSIYGDQAECIFYVPFDWRWTVRRVLKRFSPSVLLIMETEIWFNLIRESSKARMRIAIVNGRMSERSFKRYGYFKRTMKRLYGYIDRALMQTNADANRVMALGMRASKVKVTGNLKFDHHVTAQENELTEQFRTRFGITPDAPLIIAASTHAPEEEWVLDAFKKAWKASGGGLPRLMIAPRHPERFADVVELLKKTGFTWVRRTESASGRDKTAEVILLDSIGELRAAFPLAEIVFVGGSLIPHGGQSILEPAAAGKAIITGPHTANFADAIANFLERDALVQIGEVTPATAASKLAAEFRILLDRPTKRKALGERARVVTDNNRGAIDRTVEQLDSILTKSRRGSAS